MYKITLADGTVLDNIEGSGTTLVSYQPIDPSMFEHNLSPVIIKKIGESPDDLLFIDGYHENMYFEMVECPYKDTYWFTLKDIPKEELELTKIKSDIEYMSMMMDIDL